MSTQDAAGVDFLVLPEAQHEQFRLLELPPDVLQLITGETPAALKIKSRSADSTSGPSDSNAALCTADKSYQIRQVNHSNSVYIVREHNSGSDVRNVVASPAIEAFATNTFTLELVPNKDYSAIPDLKAALPVYTSNGNYDNRELQSKLQHFDNIPLSTDVCEQAWTELACFELQEPAGSFRPSASARMQVWSAMLNHAIAEDINISAPLNDTQIELLASVDETLPHELSRGVLNAVLDIERKLDADRCLRFIGSSHLEERTIIAGETSLDGFLKSWADAVPENLRGQVNVSRLEGVYHASSTGKEISFAEQTAQSKQAKAAAEAKSSLGAKRKWHEKFRAQKRTQ